MYINWSNVAKIFISAKRSSYVTTVSKGEAWQIVNAQSKKQIDKFEKINSPEFLWRGDRLAICPGWPHLSPYDSWDKLQVLQQPW